MCFFNIALNLLLKIDEYVSFQYDLVSCRVIIMKYWRNKKVLKRWNVFLIVVIKEFLRDDHGISLFHALCLRGLEDKSRQPKFSTPYCAASPPLWPCVVCATGHMTHVITCLGQNNMELLRVWDKSVVTFTGASGGGTSWRLSSLDDIAPTPAPRRVICTSISYTSVIPSVWPILNWWRHHGSVGLNLVFGDLLWMLHRPSNAIMCLVLK